MKEKEKGTEGYKVDGTRGKIVYCCIAEEQGAMIESNLKKVDCCVQSGGDFVHPWRLVRVSTLGDCWGWRVCHFCGLLKCLEC